MKKIIMVIVLVASMLGIGMAAQATGDDDQPCTVQVVDVPAHDVKVIDVPASPAIPGQWWNWSPNKDQGPFDGPPSFPTDERGTWQGPHTEGGPSQDLTGTFQQGNGHGSWFHREPGTPAVEEVSHMETIPATYKQVEVDCPPVDNPPIDEPPVVDPPKVDPPVDEPVTDKPKSRTPTMAPEAGLPNTGA